MVTMPDLCYAKMPQLWILMPQDAPCSIAGLRAYPGAIAYKMSKAGMDQLTRCSAVELAPKARLLKVEFGVVLVHILGDCYFVDSSKGQDKAWEIDLRQI